MNILLINHYAGSPNHGMEYRPYYLGREWVKLGHRVIIVAASYSHVRSRQPNVDARFIEENIDGINYVWLKTCRYSGNGIKRVLNMLNFICLLFFYSGNLMKKYSPDVVIASSTYPLDIYPAHYMASKVGAKLIFEVHDLWPLSPVELGGFSTHHPFVIIMQRAEDYAYHVSERVVSILPHTRSYMERHGMSLEKFVHIPNGIDMDSWDRLKEGLPDEHIEVLSKLKNQGVVIVGYAGAHGLANSLSTLIDAARLLTSQPVAFVLVGQGPEKEALKSKVSQLGLSNVHFLSSVPQKSIPQLLGMMDILYIGLKKQPLFRFGISPNKLMDYMMSGKPILQAIDAGNDIVRDSGCGISVQSENSEAVAEAIMHFIGISSQERYTMGLRGKEYVIINHDYRILASRFLEVIK